MRLSYEESCEKLKPAYISETPPLPERRPRYDDEAPGLSFFRTFLGDGEDLSNLTIPRTFFGRSELNDVNFGNTDLSQSCLCWNDFVDVSFAGADLRDADLRASGFLRVRFNAADLSNADLRHSTFDDCDFEHADLSAAIVSRSQLRSMRLSPEQKAAIDLRWRNGPKPDGG